MYSESYLIRTVDGREYIYNSTYESMPSVYREIKELEYIGVVNHSDKAVLVDTDFIVSIEEIYW